MQVAETAGALGVARVCHHTQNPPGFGPGGSTPPPGTMIRISRLRVVFLWRHEIENDQVEFPLDILRQPVSLRWWRTRLGNLLFSDVLLVRCAEPLVFNDAAARSDERS